MNAADDTIARLMTRGPHPRKHAITEPQGASRNE